MTWPRWRRDDKDVLGRRYNRTKKAANDGGKGTPKATESQNGTRLPTTAATLAKQRGMVGAKLANLQNGKRPPSAIALGQTPVTQKAAAAMLNVGVDTYHSGNQIPADLTASGNYDIVLCVTYEDLSEAYECTRQNLNHLSWKYLLPKNILENPQWLFQSLLDSAPASPLRTRLSCPTFRAQAAAKIKHLKSNPRPRKNSKPN